MNVEYVHNSKSGLSTFAFGILHCDIHMFRRLRTNAKASRSENAEADRIIEFCDEVLRVFEKYGFTSNK